MPRWSQSDLDAFRARQTVRAASTLPMGSNVLEKSIHEDILKFCRSNGYPVVHSRMDRPSTAEIGTPDFVVALPGGRTIWIEAKRPKGKTSSQQAAWIAALKHHGHQASVVRSFPEFLKLVG